MNGAMVAAGRDLDMRVAEEVMGCVWHQVGGDVGEVLSPPDSLHVWADTHRGDRLPTFMLPSFSTDVAWAMAVVDRLRARTRRIAIDALRNGFEVAMVDRDNEVRGEGKAETLPLAICLAALSFVEASR